jgi:hypothetical protein
MPGNVTKGLERRLGGTALIMGGADGGVVQIGRGFGVIPQQVIAPHTGKYWN